MTLWWHVTTYDTVVKCHYLWHCGGMSLPMTLWWHATTYDTVVACHYLWHCGEMSLPMTLWWYVTTYNTVVRCHYLWHCGGMSLPITPVVRCHYLWHCGGMSLPITLWWDVTTYDTVVACHYLLHYTSVPLSWVSLAKTLRSMVRYCSVISVTGKVTQLACQYKWYKSSIGCITSMKINSRISPSRCQIWWLYQLHKDLCRDLRLLYLGETGNSLDRN